LTTNLPNAYDPREIESRQYQRWLDADAFRADAASTKTPYTIVIPPPNVTGSLHMGHALTSTIQDILIRYKRMDGFEALWLPGTDHAGIATQTVVERHLAAQGLDRVSLGREAFIERVWAWKETYGNRITLQQQRLGASLDWSRERFTMDPGLSRAVREIFVRLYDDGLLYRDEKLVNWDPVSQTVLSDLEVEQEEEDGWFWHLAYPVDGTDETLVVATTRPETMLGDTAVAIHPDDPRYTHLHGRSVRLPLTDRLIPIICDPEAADMNLGSGAVKITPAHDFNDFETGRRNDLPSITVIGLDARMNDTCPEAYRGLDRYEARERIVADLDALGLLVRKEAHKMSPGRSQRSGAVVEPLSIGKQWFVRTDALAAPAIEAVRNGSVRMIPASWEKTYFHWMENIRDWCVSRQLWWGHRIPAWSCDACEEVTVARVDPTCCAHCGSDQIHQDEDVLDTWFSSGLWPFSTLGWPEDTEDLKRFYPTDVLETGFDIIFFWVARMIMMGLYAMDDAPFHTVYFHAMVRDKSGNKMSKTRGNVIDPLHVIDGVRPDDLDAEEREIYTLLLQDFPDGLQAQGADALRFTLATYAAAGRDIKLDVKRVEGYRAFMNKVWNATRFALMNLDDFTPQPLDCEAQNLSAADRWVLTRLADCTHEVTTALDEYRFSDAAQRVYEFVWHELCDWYLELIKPVTYGNAPDIPGDRAAAQCTLVYVLDHVMRLLHPFVPHISEELWGALPLAERSTAMLCHAPWPKASDVPSFREDADQMRVAIGVIGAIRRVRGESSIPPSKPLPRVIIACDPALAAIVEANQGYIRNIARIDELATGDLDAPRPDNAATTVFESAEIIIPLDGLVDLEAERTRIKKELARVEKDIAHLDKKLSNARYIENASPELVDKDRTKLADARAAHDALLAAMQRLA